MYVPDKLYVKPKMYGKMKKLILMPIILLTAINLKSQVNVLLQEGEIIQVVLTENLDSKISKPGDPVSLEVAEDVIVDSILVIEQGAKVFGTVVQTDEADLAGMKGQLGFSIDYTVAITGQNIRLRSIQYASGESITDEVVVAAILLHPLFLLFKGKDVTVEKGTVFNAYIDRDYELTF